MTKKLIDGRTQIRLTPDNQENLKALATKRGSSASGVVRDILTSYVKHGTTAQRPERRVEVAAPADLLAKAAARADKEGLGLSEIVRHELDKLARGRR